MPTVLCFPTTRASATSLRGNRNSFFIFSIVAKAPVPSRHLLRTFPRPPPRTHPITNFQHSQTLLAKHPRSVFPEELLILIEAALFLNDPTKCATLLKSYADSNKGAKVNSVAVAALAELYGSILGQHDKAEAYYKQLSREQRADALDTLCGLALAEGDPGVEKVVAAVQESLQVAREDAERRRVGMWAICYDLGPMY